MDIQRRLLSRAIITVFAVIFLTLLVIPSPEAQAKPKEFVIGVVADLTGPYAAVVGPTGPGVEDSVKYINAEMGGIDGVPLKAYIRDNQGQVTIGLQQYAELVDKKPWFLGFWHASTFEAVRQKLVHDNIIAFGGPNVEAVYPQANSYGSYVLYPEMVGSAVKAARDLWKEKRPPRAAILTWDTSFGRAILTPEFMAYMK
ncbi:MAG: ABC transporter substrate-binding protein, partial [Thermodesulfobacteriota bacterium]|nr:ABC transporter substrate-binding protein [Thermodesulfobacteriota bacterium]